MTNRLRRVALLAWLGLGALAGCAAPSTPPAAEAVAALTPVPQGPFDQARAGQLLAEAQAAEQAGRDDEAIGLYREAGLAWPDEAGAWAGLRDLAAAQGRQEEAEAASFMVERASLYPSDQLYVQREINRSLQAYIAESEAAGDANPAQLGYARTLTQFYDWRYAARGAYQPPSRIANIRRRDIPAVIASGGGLIGYAVSLVSGAQATQ